MIDYRNAIKRAERLVKDIDAILSKMHDLEEANRKLRKDRDTFELRDQARERVVESFLNDTPPHQG